MRLRLLNVRQDHIVLSVMFPRHNKDMITFKFQTFWKAFIYVKSTYLTSVSVPVPYLTAQDHLRTETMFFIFYIPRKRIHIWWLHVWYENATNVFCEHHISAFLLFVSKLYPGTKSDSQLLFTSLIGSFMSPVLSVHILLWRIKMRSCCQCTVKKQLQQIKTTACVQYCLVSLMPQYEPFLF